MRYEDDRVSSQGQQVTAYPHRDVNNLFIVEPVDPEKRPPVYELTKEEQERKVRYVRNGDLVRLRHAFTDSYLITHDVASPLTTTNMEVTTWPAADATRYEETIWRLENTRGEDGNKLMTRKDTIRVVNDFHKVALFTSKKSILPKWGFDQQEINGNKNVKEPTNLWFVDEVQHERIINGKEEEREGGDCSFNPRPFLP